MVGKLSKLAQKTQSQPSRNKAVPLILERVLQKWLARSYLYMVEMDKSASETHSEMIHFHQKARVIEKRLVYIEQAE